jgi:ABC-type branched-subunit amino acid transport system ATPase component
VVVSGSKADNREQLDGSCSYFRACVNVLPSASTIRRWQQMLAIGRALMSKPTLPARY